MDHTRLARIEGSADDGTFSMTLATAGEASDGHILDIAGGIVPERLPLLLSHQNDPRSHIGSITSAKREGDRLRAVGQIELGGEGAQGDIRRDVFHMIQAGHIGAVSLRWDPIKAMGRAELPKNHPAYVERSEGDSRKRYGLYFQKWRALEGSIVSVGADPAALIGRAAETAGEVAEFWRSMAAENSISTDRGVPIEELETAMARVLELEQCVESLEALIRASQTTEPEPPTPLVVAPEKVVPLDVEQMLRAVVGDYEARLEKRMREFAFNRLGRVL
jgi:hypothetical protein